MMKDMNGLSHHIDILIHRYLVQAYHMRANDIEIRPFTYCCDTFNTCSNPRRVTVSDTSVATKSFSLLPLLPIVYHYPIKFTSKPIIQSYFTLPPKSSIFHRIVLPEDILWLLLTLYLTPVDHYFLVGQEVPLLTLFSKQILDNTIFLPCCHHLKNLHICLYCTLTYHWRRYGQELMFLGLLVLPLAFFMWIYRC